MLLYQLNRRGQCLRRKHRIGIGEQQQVPVGSQARLVQGKGLAIPSLRQSSAGNDDQTRIPGLQFPEDGEGLVGGLIVHHDHFKIRVILFEK